MYHHSNSVTHQPPKTIVLKNTTTTTSIPPFCTAATPLHTATHKLWKQNRDAVDDDDAVFMLVKTLKARLKLDLNYYRMMKAV